MTSGERKGQAPPTWEMAFAWCPPSDSPMLGSQAENSATGFTDRDGDSDAAPEDHNREGRRRRLRFQATKQGNTQDR
ncbi:MAG: hypothetical protein BMS9Abin12_1292 [Acidimicrobiia bacterium]|nr:MAG: hypothetical protein BMS9Abin12_1292 [Acidimicrobiia bacterium]